MEFCHFKNLNRFSCSRKCVHFLRAKLGNFGPGHSPVYSVIQIENKILKFSKFQSEFEWNKFMHCSRAEIGCSGQFGGGPKLLDIYVKLSTRASCPPWLTNLSNKIPFWTNSWSALSNQSRIKQNLCKIFLW